MKTKRHKHVTKVLTFYKNNFAYHPPYHVLVDGTFCKAALKFKVNIAEQLPKYLEAEVKLFTTTCSTAECEALGTLLYGPLKVLQQFDIEPCSHGKAVAASKCLNRLARRQDRHKYIVATQDTELSEAVRGLPGIPLLFISHNAITLESPSQASMLAADSTEHSKLMPSQHQRKTLETLKKTVLGEPEVRAKRKRKGPKGPNPLSCKKKKKPAIQAVSSGKVRKRRRRRKAHGRADTLKPAGTERTAA